MASHGNVVIATSADHFSQQITEAKACNKAVVIDFTATWCGPCKAIAPFFAQLSEQFSNVVFLKVDVDDLQTVTKEYGVEAMPTFVFLKDGNEVDKVVGANKPQLEAKVKQLASA